MKIIETVAETRAACLKSPRPLGLIPTMGFLHDGHMALVKQCRSDNEYAVASIFVNPAQFGPQEDFSTYPRDMDADLAKLEEAGVDLVFAPSLDEVYPEGFATFVDVGPLGKRLEGEFRPGHFRGVATVVCKLLSIVRPDRAYFGQKDAQQCKVVEALSRDLNLGAEIVVVPTVRDPDGLALSSRNAYLGEKERTAALLLSASLNLAKEIWLSGGTDTGQVKDRMRALIEGNPLARIDYVSIADGDTLEELEQLRRSALVLLAVNIGKTRLIDNVVL
jgi:pantoate--beta-alanine ligase